MNKLIVFALVVLPFFGKSQDKSDAVEMQLVSEIKKSPSVSFFLTPMSLSGRGGIIDYNVGAYFYGFNISNKYNLYAEYNLDLGHYDKNYDDNSYQSIDLLNKKSNYLEINLGYTLKEEKNNTEKSITLQKVGNYEAYTVLKAKEFVTTAARIGFINQGQFLSGMFEVNAVGQTKYMIYNNLSDLTIGYQSVSSLKSKYKTDKFGEVNANYQNTYYADLLFSIPSKFTYIDNRQQSTTAFPVLTTDLTMDQQNEFRSNFKKLPFGFRAGFRSASSIKKIENIRVSFCLELGCSSGYYQSTKTFGVADLLYAKFSFGIGLLQMLK